MSCICNPALCLCQVPYVSNGSLPVDRTLLLEESLADELDDDMDVGDGLDSASWRTHTAPGTSQGSGHALSDGSMPPVLIDTIKRPDDNAHEEPLQHASEKHAEEDTTIVDATMSNETGQRGSDDASMERTVVRDASRENVPTDSGDEDEHTDHGAQMYRRYMAEKRAREANSAARSSVSPMQTDVGGGDTCSEVGRLHLHFGISVQDSVGTLVGSGCW